MRPVGLLVGLGLGTLVLTMKKKTPRAPIDARSPGIGGHAMNEQELYQRRREHATFQKVWGSALQNLVSLQEFYMRVDPSTGEKIFVEKNRLVQYIKSLWGNPNRRFPITTATRSVDETSESSVLNTTAKQLLKLSQLAPLLGMRPEPFARAFRALGDIQAGET